MGSAVGIHTEDDDDANVKAYLADSKKMDSLFTEIASKAKEGTINIKTRINLTNILNYFSDHPDKLFAKFVKNKSVLISAYKFTSHQEAHSQIKRSEFHMLMASIYLFSYLWDVIDVIDHEDHEKRVSRDNYIKSKEICQSMHFLEISKITDQQWMDEFARLDKNADNSISFHELCLYVTSNIVNMDYFMTEEDQYRLYKDPKKDTDEEEDEEEVVGEFQFVSAAAAVAAWEAEQALKKSKGALDELHNKVSDPEKSEEIEHIIQHAIETAEMAKQKVSHDISGPEAWEAESRANKALLEMEFALTHMTDTSPGVTLVTSASTPEM